MTMARTQPFIIAGNWKMNPQTIHEARKLFAGYKRLASRHEDVTFVAAVPSIFIGLLGRTKTMPDNLFLSAQRISEHDAGAHTGDVSLPMILDAGAHVTIIGHSEQRITHDVTDAVVSKRIEQCIAQSVPMIVCFGEHERDLQGHYSEELERQLSYITKEFVSKKSVELLNLAYEPVWATGEHATRAIDPEELFATILLVRNILDKQLGRGMGKKVTLVYGGSVNSENARVLSAVPGIDGFLLGRASLDLMQIQDIVHDIQKNK